MRHCLRPYNNKASNHKSKSPKIKVDISLQNLHFYIDRQTSQQLRMNSQEIAPPNSYTIPCPNL